MNARAKQLLSFTKKLTSIKDPKAVQKLEPKLKNLEKQAVKNKDKVTKTARKVYKAIGETENEKKESHVIMMAIKSLFTGIGSTGVKFFSPTQWVVLLIVKSFALKHDISMTEAWKRLFRFDAQSVVNKWPEKYKQLFWRRMAINIAAMLVGGAATGAFMWSLNKGGKYGAAVGAFLAINAIILSAIGYYYTYLLMKYKLTHKATGEEYKESTSLLDETLREFLGEELNG